MTRGALCKSSHPNRIYFQMSRVGGRHTKSVLLEETCYFISQEQSQPAPLRANLFSPASLSTLLINYQNSLMHHLFRESVHLSWKQMRMVFTKFAQICCSLSLWSTESVFLWFLRWMTDFNLINPEPCVRNACKANMSINKKQWLLVGVGPVAPHKLPTDAYNCICAIWGLLERWIWSNARLRDVKFNWGLIDTGTRF